MVVYNGERFISKAIQSILSQTYSNFEFIIVEDGSIDRTLEKVRVFKDPRIKLIIHENNKGVVVARNTALKASTGSYIAILDADDISLHDRLEIQVKFLEKNPDFGLIGGRAEVIGDDGVKLNRIQSLSLPPEETRVYLLFKNCFTHSSVMYRKKILENIEFNPDFKVGEDYEIIVKIASQVKIKNLLNIVSQYRVHNKNISKEKKLLEENNQKIISHQLSQLGIDVNEKNMNIHLQLRKMSKHTDLQLILDMVDWLDKLFTANQKMNIYPEIAFYNRLAGYWFNLMGNPYQYNIKLLQPYVKSPILRSSNRKLIDHLKFTVKCLFKYKSRNL